MPISQRTSKIVWGQCAARCCICQKDLVIEANDGVASLIGEVAHIVGEMQKAARGKSPLSLKERNDADNLLLLCRDHHKIIDDNPDSYSISDLHDIKAKHLSFIASGLTKPRAWRSNMSHLAYINVPRLCEQAERSGYQVDLSHYKSNQTLHSLRWDLNHVMSAFRTVLSHLSVEAIPVQNVVLHEAIVGAVISFDRQRFRTKNVHMESSTDTSVDWKFTGSLVKDPHIYCQLREFKVVMFIDPRWITTSTAFTLFRPSSGQSLFTGLGRVTSVDYEAGIVTITPWVIGVPRSPFEDLFDEVTAVPAKSSQGTASLDSLVDIEKGKRDDVYFVPPPTHCDLCRKTLSKDKYMIDGQVKDLQGKWACMCAVCFNQRGSRIGLGYGQLYLRDENGWLGVAGFHLPSEIESKF